jgi:hypothetical protein
VEAEVTESINGVLEDLTSGNGAPVEGVEDPGMVSGDLTEGKIGVDGGSLFVEVEEELGFDADEAAEDPLAIDDVIDEAGLFGGGGVEAGVVLGDEELVSGEVLGGEDGGMEGAARGRGYGSGAVLLPPVGVVFEFIHGSLPGAIGARRNGAIRSKKS